MSWGFENEAKLYFCEVTGFKLCPSVFAHTYKIMLYWSQGTGDIDCHFKIRKNLENASISLESAKNPGLFVGIQSDGKAKPVIYTKDGNAFFYPQVIKCTFTLKYLVLLCDGLCTVSDNFTRFFTKQISAVRLFIVVIVEAVKNKHNEDHLPHILRYVMLGIEFLLHEAPL